MEEFVTAVAEVFPAAVLQFEDFATDNAINLLARYRDRTCTFNDDIQGTAAVALAGLYAAVRITGRPLREQRLVFLGAGSAATGIADLVARAMTEEGLDLAAARARIALVDSKGLVTRDRTGLAAHKLPYAIDAAPAPDLLGAVTALRPTTLVGVSAVPHTLHPAGARGHGGHQRAAHRLRPVESHQPRRVHRRGGVSLDRWPRDLRLRQPLRRRSRSAAAPGCPGRETTPTSSPAWGSA